MTSPRPTGLSVRYHRRQVFLGRLVSRIICKDVHLKCFKRRRVQELTDANYAARMKRAMLLLQKFPQSATDFVFVTDEKMFSFASPDNRQNKVSGRLQELHKKRFSIFFSAGTVRSATAWPPFNCACVPQLDNSLLTPRFVQLFSENYYSVNLFAAYPFKYKLFLSNSCPRRWIPCSLLTNTAKMSVVTNFWCQKLIAKANK